MSRGSQRPPPSIVVPDTVEILTGDLESEGDGPDSFLRAVAATSLRSEHVGQLARDSASLGGYRLGERIGSGGMGIVYRAHDPAGAEVALKVLRRRDDARPEQRKRFLREARSQFAVQHPNVARVLEIGEHEEEAFIAMELLSGESLRSVMSRGPLTIAAVVELALGVARGVAAAHAAGIVHRDLKPENVMVEPDGCPKVLDFGLARWAEAAEGKGLDSVLTVDGSVLGTPGYMSPEQSRGLAVDARTDLFSFGVLLFELLTGRRPFTGDSKADVFIALNRQPAPGLDTLRAEVPVELSRLVSWLLQKDPAARPPSMEVVITTLEATAV